MDSKTQITNSKSELKLVLGTINYARTEFTYKIGYTDGEWVWVIEVNSPWTNVPMKGKKVFPKSKIGLIGKVRLGPSCNEMIYKENLKIFQNFFPSFTLEEVKKMKMHNKYRNAKTFNPYELCMQS